MIYIQHMLIHIFKRAAIYLRWLHTVSLSHK